MVVEGTLENMVVNFSTAKKLAKKCPDMKTVFLWVKYGKLEPHVVINTDTQNTYTQYYKSQGKDVQAYPAPTAEELINLMPTVVEKNELPLSKVRTLKNVKFDLKIEFDWMYKKTDKRFFVCGYEYDHYICGESDYYYLPKRVQHKKLAEALGRTYLGIHKRGIAWK